MTECAGAYYLGGKTAEPSLSSSEATGSNKSIVMSTPELMPRESRLPHSIGRDSWLLPFRLALPVRPEQVFVLLIATGECAVMCVMERFADAPREMGVGRGDDHPFGCFGLVLDLDNSS